MKRLVWLAVLAGCSASPGPTTPQDETLRRLNDAGDAAYNLEEPGQAAEQYRAALGRARQRDDATAIDDAGFNLATAELRENRPKAAMKTAAELRAELSQRGVADPAFDLVTATALFRLGDLAAADRAAAPLAAGRNRALADAAWFLRGLIADARGDASLLHQAAAALSPAADPADKAELRARVAHDPALAAHAADLRRTALDYRGMARALALAAQYTPDPAGSADLFLRAGQSAAEQHDAAQARAWLLQVRARTPDPVVRAEAERILRSLRPRSAGE